MGGGGHGAIGWRESRSFTEGSGLPRAPEQLPRLPGAAATSRGPPALSAFSPPALYSDVACDSPCRFPLPAPLPFTLHLSLFARPLLQAVASAGHTIQAAEPLLAQRDPSEVGQGHEYPLLMPPPPPEAPHVGLQVFYARPSVAVQQFFASIDEVLQDDLRITHQKASLAAVRGGKGGGLRGRVGARKREMGMGRKVCKAA